MRSEGARAAGLEELRVDCDKLAAELPAFMLYALATGGRRAVHEALLELGRSGEAPDVLNEFAKLARIYDTFTRIYGNHAIALEKVSSTVCRDVLAPLFGDYVALQLTRGRPRELLVHIVGEVGKLFRRHLDVKLSQLLSAIEFAIMLLTVVIISIFISSFISLNASLISLLTTSIAVLAIPLSRILRIEVLDTYVRSPKKHMLLLALDALLVTLLVLGWLDAGVWVVLATVTLTAKLVGILKLYKLIGSIGVLYRIAGLLSETLGIPSKSLVVRRLQSLGSQGKILAYTLSRGRVPGIAGRDVSSTLTLMLARVVALAGRSGGASLSAVRFSAGLLELIYSMTRRLFARFIALNALTAATIITVQWALVAVTKMVENTATLSSMLIPLPDASMLASFSTQLTFLGLILSYMVTYAVIKRPWLNFSAPIILLSQALLEAQKALH
jgi:hypothetical protein